MKTWNLKQLSIKAKLCAELGYMSGRAKQRIDVSEYWGPECKREWFSVNVEWTININLINAEVL